MQSGTALPNVTSNLQCLPKPKLFVLSRISSCLGIELSAATPFLPFIIFRTKLLKTAPVVVIIVDTIQDIKEDIFYHYRVKLVENVCSCKKMWYGVYMHPTLSPSYLVDTSAHVFVCVNTESCSGEHHARPVVKR